MGLWSQSASSVVLYHLWDLQTPPNSTAQFGNIWYILPNMKTKNAPPSNVICPEQFTFKIGNLKYQNHKDTNASVRIIRILHLLVILCICSSYERTHLVLFHSIVLLQSYTSVEFQHLALLDVFKIAASKLLLSVFLLHPDPSWTLQTGSFTGRKVATEVFPAPLTCLGPSEKQQNWSCKCLSAHIFPCLTCPRATQ